MHENASPPPRTLYLVPMAFRVVLVRFPVFLVPGGLVQAVAERLVLGKAAHANPDRLFLRFNFQRSFVRFDDSAHCQSYAVRNSSQANRLIPNQYLRLQHPARENVRQAQMGVGGIHLATINSEIL